MKSLMYVWMFILILGCNDSDEIIETGNALSVQEVEDLQYMKEEEKLARDVYLFSYELYGQMLFKNISNSEQSHMNHVSVIMKKYNVEDVSLEERGQFSNLILQELYDDLVDQSSGSVEDALIVGATIEDLDIKDLNNAISNTDHQDIEDMYKILRCGSRNHMRAFTNNLENMGVFYTPQFISLDAYNDIINNPNEKCNN